MARDDLVYYDSVVDALRSALREGQAGLGDVPGLLKQVLRDGMWRKRVVVKMGSVQRFERFEDFVRTPPLEGLGATLPLVKRLAGDDRELLDLLDQATQQEAGNPTFGAGEPIVDIINNSTDKRPDGTSEQYALRRLRKQRPELHQRVLAGELSPHRAMVEAGFRTPTLTVPLDPARAARILAKHFDVMQLIDALARLAAPKE